MLLSLTFKTNHSSVNTNCAVRSSSVRSSFRASICRAACMSSTCLFCSFCSACSGDLGDVISEDRKRRESLLRAVCVAIAAVVREAEHSCDTGLIGRSFFDFICIAFGYHNFFSKFAPFSLEPVLVQYGQKSVVVLLVFFVVLSDSS